MVTKKKMKKTKDVERIHLILLLIIILQQANENRSRREMRIASLVPNFSSIDLHFLFRLHPDSCHKLIPRNSDWMMIILKRSLNVISIKKNMRNNTINNKINNWLQIYYNVIKINMIVINIPLIIKFPHLI